jgi:predicted dehydrogenase
MKKYAIVGAGGRATQMFAIPLTSELKDDVKFVGVYDVNPIRARLLSDAAGGIPVFDDFDTMIRSAKPDSVIVTTPDSSHDYYIIRCLEAGCDVISEKPMTTTAEKCRAVLEAERRTGRQVTVTFNCRFMPYVVRVKELLKEGVIGQIHSVALEWSLDRDHGADYFRRWHRRMANSGGLLIHKSTHHFDMVNWWLEDEPESVFASGELSFYGATREERGERCWTCAHQSTCDFYYDISASEFTKTLYQQAEQSDGYYRDQCVFGEDIDIYDTMSLQVKYTKGALLTYSLQAYSPYEGWKATFVGTKGRLEAQEYQSGFQKDLANEIRIYNRTGEVQSLHSQKAAGAHGGGDVILRKMIFTDDVPDPLGQKAGSRAGAMSLMIGAAANVSIKEKRLVTIRDLLPG